MNWKLLFQYFVELPIIKFKIKYTLLLLYLECLFRQTMYKIGSMQVLMKEVIKNVNFLFAYALKQCKFMRWLKLKKNMEILF